MSPSLSRPAVLVARAMFPEVIDRLQAQFEVSCNSADEPWSQAELIRQLQGKAGVLVTTGERIDAALLAACPDLRVVCSMAVGHNNIDVAACTAHGVRVSNAPDVLTETTADFGFALMMATARRITEAERYLRAGHWTRWSVDQLAGRDVHGSTLAILGMGRIGQAVTRRAALGFGMRVIYHKRSRLTPDLERSVGASWVEKDTLLREADHLMLVLPYSPQTHHIMGAAELALMKPSATLTNIARGGVVDDVALAAALREGRLAGAGLDVFEGEPQVHPELLALSNVVLTPHIASSSGPTRRAMAHLAADNLLAALTGAPMKTPLNQLSGPTPPPGSPAGLGPRAG